MMGPQVAPDIKALTQIGMQLLEQHGWTGFHLSHLAQASGYSLTKVHQHFPSKYDLFSAILTYLLHLQEERLNAFSAPQATRRERLWELLMLRFESFMPYRPLLYKLWLGVLQDPVLLGYHYRINMPFFKKVVQLAGWPAPGVYQEVRIKAVYGLYLRVAREWVQADDPHMNQTMAELDQGLQVLEEWHLI